MPTFVQSDKQVCCFRCEERWSVSHCFYTFLQWFKPGVFKLFW